MITQRDMQAAYEYGVKLAYEHLQKSAGGPSQTAMFHDGGAAYNAAHQPPPSPLLESTRLPPDAFPSPQMPAAERGISQTTLDDVMAAIREQGGNLRDKVTGLPDQARALAERAHIPTTGAQMGELASRGYGAANSVADRFLSHMGRHPAAYGLGAAGIGAAGLTGLGLGIGNAVHNSRD